MFSCCRENARRCVYHRPIEAFAGRMLVTESGRSADVTTDVARCRERTAVVLLRFKNHDVDFRQEQQDQRDRR